METLFLYLISYIWSEKLCEDIFLRPKSGYGVFLAEVKEQIMLPEMFEESQEFRNVQDMQLNQVFPEGNMSNSLSWPKFPPEKGCGRTAGVLGLGWDTNDSC